MLCVQVLVAINMTCKSCVFSLLKQNFLHLHLYCCCTYIIHIFISIFIFTLTRPCVNVLGCVSVNEYTIYPL